MDATVRERMVERFRLTLALFEFGEAILCQRLRRTHPAASDAEIQQVVTEWVQRRSGAEGGDCPGRVCRWPRR